MDEKPVILCIDDQQENLRIRTLLLELFGCATVAVADYRSALKAVTEQKIDLILIDYHLADGRNGEEIARDVRVIRPHLPLVMLTGDSNIPGSARACVDAVLVKGASDPKTLLATIERLLPHSKLKPRRENILPDRSSKAS